MSRLWLLLVFCTLSSSVLAASPEAELVVRFAEGLGTNNSCKECISEKYMKAYKLPTDNVKFFWVKGQITLVSDKPPFVTVEILNEQEGFAYQLRFKVAREDGKLVIVPRRPPRLDEGNAIYPYDSKVRVMWNHKRLTQAEQQSYIDAGKMDEQRIAAEVALNASWTKNLKEGDETNCGPVLEVKRSLVKVYFPVQNYGNEHWIRIDQIRSPGSGCRFINGRYVE